MTARVVVVAAGSHIFRAAHAPAIVELGLNVVGLYDSARERVESVGSEFGWPVVETLEELLALDADLAVICAPHPAHVDLALRCIAAGRAILVEKPLAARLGEIDAIVEAVATTGVTVAVVQQHRTRAEVREARRLVAAGHLGRIHHAVVVASYPKRSNYYSDTPWRGTWQGEGGGVLLNQGLHDIDMLLHILGSPRRVIAVMRTRVHPVEAEDTSDVLLEWQDGATASIHVTSAAPLDETRIEVFGSRGSLRISARGLESREFPEDFDVFAATSGGHFDAFPVGEWRLIVPHAGGTHRDVYTDLLAALEGESEPAATASDARAAVEVIAAASLSSLRGAPVGLPLDAAAQDAFVDERILAAIRSDRPTASTPGARTVTRSPALEQTPLNNLRDLGGIPVSGGVIAAGRVFRSDDVSTIPSDEAQALFDRGIRTILDLRSAAEAGHTGRGPLGSYDIAYHPVPIVRGIADHEEFVAHLRDGTGTADVVGEYYATTLVAEAETIGRGIRRIAEARAGVLFHCAAGKDRTGVFAAALLAELGASRDDIAADYARSAEAVPRIMARVSAAIGHLLGESNTYFLAASKGSGPVSALLGAEAAAMKTMIDIVEERHGGIPAVLRGAGFDDATRDLLRRRLVTRRE
ncbi:tyrosine-protein phosphatase [Luethyella okanaganae]|uniref:Tyrosine-protein phosphatase n=1 Tax=Luethyella okanaganae TaxID=69372 RepID=A0ABW1VH44_9MICO